MNKSFENLFSKPYNASYCYETEKWQKTSHTLRRFRAYAANEKEPRKNANQLESPDPIAEHYLNKLENTIYKNKKLTKDSFGIWHAITPEITNYMHTLETRKLFMNDDQKNCYKDLLLEVEQLKN